MKTLNMLIIVTMALFTSCVEKNIQMNTTLREDGTCKRELWFKTDSASLVNPTEAHETFVQGVLDDEAWSKTWIMNSESEEKSYPMTVADYEAIQAALEPVNGVRKSTSDTVKIHAQREFTSVGEMAQALPLFLNGEQVKSTAKLEKKFRWFYTDYVYTERFEGYDAKLELPLSRYMTDETASYWLTGTPNLMQGKSGMEMKEYQDKIENQFYQFINDNMLNDLMKVLADNYELIENAPVSREEFMNKRDSILTYSTFLNKMPDNEYQFKPEEILKKYFKTDVYKDAVELNQELNHQWDKRSGVYTQLVLFSVDYQLTMPGGIINVNECQNCVMVNGELHATLDGMRLLMPEYTIQASSSVKNDWALILTVLITLLAIALCTMGFCRRGKVEK